MEDLSPEEVQKRKIEFLKESENSEKKNKQKNLLERELG
jgi:hypothetical protein